MIPDHFKRVQLPELGDGPDCRGLLYWEERLNDGVDFRPEEYVPLCCRAELDRPPSE